MHWSGSFQVRFLSCIFLESCRLHPNVQPEHLKCYSFCWYEDWNCALKCHVVHDLTGVSKLYTMSHDIVFASYIAKGTECSAKACIFSLLLCPLLWCSRHIQVTHTIHYENSTDIQSEQLFNFQTWFAKPCGVSVLATKTIQHPFVLVFVVSTTSSMNDWGLNPGVANVKNKQTTACHQHKHLRVSPL